MELGQAMQALPEAEDALAARDYDFVIGSLHNVAGEEDFWKVDYKTRDAGKLLHRYYDELLELLEPFKHKKIESRIVTLFFYSSLLKNFVTQKVHLFVRAKSSKRVLK